jgi:LPXTG-motif cell wall-anchored protein
MRVPGFVRSRAGRLSVAAAVVAAGVLTTAAPAYAHHSVLSGSTVCSDGEHVVTWTIQAMSVVDLPMTIDSASASNNGSTYAVTGYTSPVPDEQTTTATTVLPAGSTGTVTLYVHSSWSDGVQYSDQTSVELEDDCMPATTSTTEAPATSTTEAPTTTTTEAPPTSTTEATTTTTIFVEGSTTVPPFTVPPPESSTTTSPDTPISGQATTTVPGAPVGSLPRTGSDFGFPIVFGLCLLGSGTLLVMRRRRAWSR